MPRPFRRGRRARALWADDVEPEAPRRRVLEVLDLSVLELVMNRSLADEVVVVRAALRDRLTASGPGRVARRRDARLLDLFKVR